MNATYNATRGNQTLPNNFLSGDPRVNTLTARVTGNFSGSTDEILQWAACKWGVDEDMVRAQAALDGRFEINDRDILLAAELALPHRMKKQPFQETVLNPEQLQTNMRQARADAEQNAPDESDNAEMEGQQHPHRRRGPQYKQQ